MKGVTLSLVLTTFWVFFAVAAENPAAPVQDAVKSAGQSPAALPAPNAPLADPSVERQITVDEKGIKVLKLTGNNPSFEAEHMKWQRQRDAQIRAKAAAEEQRQRADAQATSASKQVSDAAADHDQKKTAEPRAQKLVKPRSGAQKSKQPVYTMQGGGTVP